MLTESFLIHFSKLEVDSALNDKTPQKTYPTSDLSYEVSIRQLK